VTVPAALQSHFLAENARTQLVFFAKMDESDAGALQLFDQLHLVKRKSWCSTGENSRSSNLPSLTMSVNAWYCIVTIPMNT
jgi:hypothetical protein